MTSKHEWAWVMWSARSRARGVTDKGKRGGVARTWPLVAMGAFVAALVQAPMERAAHAQGQCLPEQLWCVFRNLSISGGGGRDGQAAAGT
jgi:hypothetical protein